jgi:hypothetical protein
LLYTLRFRIVGSAKYSGWSELHFTRAGLIEAYASRLADFAI